MKKLMIATLGIALMPLALASPSKTLFGEPVENYIHTSTVYTMSGAELENVEVSVIAGQGTVGHCTNKQQLVHYFLPAVYDGLEFGIGDELPKGYGCMIVKLRHNGITDVDAFTLITDENNDKYVASYPMTHSAYLR